jgi:hypothetical protein
MRVLAIVWIGILVPLTACGPGRMVSTAEAHVRTYSDDTPGKTSKPKSYRKAKQCVIELNPTEPRCR